MFRRKHHDEEDGAVKPGEAERSGQDLAAPPLKPFSRKGSHMPPKSPGIPSPVATPSARHDIPRRGVDPARRYERLRPSDEESKKLTVGRDICLAGEITSCHRLVVEGRVEAALSDAHAIDIAATGVFKGSAIVSEADISGLYDGELTARDTLTVRAGGRINGTVRYGRIIIEAGGEISGDMRALGNELEAEEAIEPSAEPLAAPEAADDLLPHMTDVEAEAEPEVEPETAPVEFAEPVDDKDKSEPHF